VDWPVEGAFENGDGAHGSGINHLLVELRVAIGGRQPVAGQDMGIIQVDRWI